MPADPGHHAVTQGSCVLGQSAAGWDAAALKVGGRLVYSTCSFAPEENEANLAYMLSPEPGAEVVPLGIDESRLSNALLEWRGHQFDVQVGHARRVLPDRLWDGFFLAKVVKKA